MKREIIDYAKHNKVEALASAVIAVWGAHCLKTWITVGAREYDRVKRLNDDDGETGTQ